MVLKNERYKITVRTEYKPSLDGYYVIYQRDDLNFDDFYTARFIDIEPRGGQIFRVAVLDFLVASIEPCAVLEGDTLTMILFRTILQIDLNIKKVVQCVDCENTGGLEEIHPIEGGYIIKGEGTIFRYDKELNQVWWRAGRDIFATPKGDDCFWLEGNVIHCLDWLGWHYVLDMNGKLISESQQETLNS